MPCPIDGCKLREANLSGAQLQGATVLLAEMTGVNLRGDYMIAIIPHPPFVVPIRRNPSMSRVCPRVAIY